MIFFFYYSELKFGKPLGIVCNFIKNNLIKIIFFNIITIIYKKNVTITIKFFKKKKNFKKHSFIIILFKYIFLIYFINCKKKCLKSKNLIKIDIFRKKNKKCLTLLLHKTLIYYIKIIIFKIELSKPLLFS